MPDGRDERGDTSLYINCGAETDWIDAQGHRWLTDRLAVESSATPDHGAWLRVGGSSGPRESALPLHPASHAGLLHCECVRPARYMCRPGAGTWRITLVVAETHETLSTHNRHFSLSINGQTLAAEINPFAVAQGHARAGELVIDGVPADRDGCIDIGFGPDANLYGLAITPSQDGTRTILSRALDPQPLPPLPASHGVRRVRMLWLGHSGTFFWAIPESVQRAVALAGCGIELDICGVYHGGQGCERFCTSTEFRSALAEGGWDFVVIQDSSWGPFTHPDVFAAVMPELIALVRAHGAQPLLYSYSAPLAHSAANRAVLIEAYDRLGSMYNVPVIPCAAATQAARARWPDIDFHNPDGHHNGIRAGYLMSCVWLRALTGRSAGDLAEHSILAGWVHVPTDMAEPLWRLADEICMSRRIGLDADNAILTRRS
jgi:hypothetical protein